MLPASGYPSLIRSRARLDLSDHAIDFSCVVRADANILELLTLATTVQKWLGRRDQRVRARAEGIQQVWSRTAKRSAHEFVIARTWLGGCA
ncbi:hypothetical protein CHR55_33620 [Rhodococcus qingshengii]|uniref:Uncharacterized protein n=1 Tax=Rhodococcus qingshengii TaxID=334542 RepID=A0A2A5IWV2_RHOSG|nr:hypothetical protein CHR55_33620 [Rhodococcus qingshengii]